MSTFHLGLDAGGSRTGAVLLDADGALRGRGEGPGANPAGQRPGDVLAHLGAAAAGALDGRDPRLVGSCLVGLAGYRALPDPERFAERCRAALRLGCPVRLVPDTVPALACGGVTDGHGTVLIAGTGTVCARLAGTRTIARAGGLGWLLGDEGGGFWLGREALRHAHADPAGPLGAAVRAHCAADSPDDLLRWAYQGPPRRLAALAPLVSRLAEEGDGPALAIAHTAAGHLAALARVTAVPEEPLVLAGAVATSAGPVRERLLVLLADLHPRLPRTDPATAAARLSARHAAHRPAAHDPLDDDPLSRDAAPDGPSPDSRSPGDPSPGDR
ncbi:N-acetylglucosamine kinase [Kitasatospora sp. NPDC051705]|uniref:N-acetylglucosamine kinase n=1 Tax=Kitasatospora sp. NPDC051705 TaxID=3364057 RepID=UPI0037A19964